MEASVWKGALLAVMAAVSLTLMSVFVKLIGSSIPVYELIWVRFLMGLIFLMPVIVLSHGFSFKLQNPLRFLLRTICALLGLALLFLAVQRMALSQALLLSNTTPLIVPILAFLMLGAKITRWGILGVVIGFIGVAVVLNPAHASIGWGDLLALASAFFVALAILQIRLLGKTMATWPMLFYYFLMSTILTTPFGLIKVVVPSSGRMWLFLLLIGVVGFIYQICSTLSYKLAPVRLTTPILYINVLLGGVFEWAIWGQKPTASFLIGCVIIVSGVVITLFLGTPRTKSTGDNNEKDSTDRS